MDAAGKMFGVVLFNEFLIGINLARSSKTINRVPVQTMALSRPCCLVAYGFGDIN